MDPKVVVAASAVERRGIADLVEGLRPEQLDTPSLCAGWSVRTVAAHLAFAVAPDRRAFLVAVLRHGGRFHAANDAVARSAAMLPPAELAGRLRRHADSPFSPPVTGVRGPLTDALVHGGDMRVPLGLPHDPEPAHVRLALEFVTTGRPVGFVPRGRLRGLRLVARDLEWSWGEGETVEGRGIDLLMAACGRAAVLDALSGPGVAALTGRLSTRAPAVLR